jgi:hypothetical protein
MLFFCSSVSYVIRTDHLQALHSSWTYLKEKNDNDPVLYVGVGCISSGRTFVSPGFRSVFKQLYAG